MVPFSNAYMTGFLAEKYDVDAEAAVPRADERVKGSAAEVLEKTVQGYTKVTCTATNINKQSGSVSYAMAPVWIVTTRYKDKPYTFMMNGQTGKVAGALPWSRLKTLFFLVLVFSVFWPVSFYLIKSLCIFRKMRERYSRLYLVKVYVVYSLVFSIIVSFKNLVFFCKSYYHCIMILPLILAFLLFHLFHRIIFEVLKEN